MAAMNTEVYKLSPTDMPQPQAAIETPRRRTTGPPAHRLRFPLVRTPQCAARRIPKP
ncbi:hypothetical protein Sros01_54420 [Streptomyces roseochromogenus]|nr:hypothetical protein Sros01_54420 [Streptomyces roseochromogenus]